MAVNKVRISVGSTELTVLAEDDAAYVQKLGNEIDAAYKKIISSNGRISATQAAILVALDYADESKKATLTADRLRDQIKDYLDDARNSKNKADWARHELEVARKQLEELTAENIRLRRELDSIVACGSDDIVE